MPFPTVLLTILCAGALYILSTSQAKRTTPPGPKPLPFIGNVLDFPTKKAWITYSKWKEQYGDMIYLNMLGQPMVILNSLHLCNELLEKRSAKYSDRPHSIMLAELMGWDFNFSLMPYSPRWRRHRRLFHQQFTETACLKYHPVQQRSVNRLLQRLLATPGKFLDHARLAFADTILDVIYGIQVEGPNNIFVQNAEKAVASVLLAAIPGQFLVDVFPILNYVPSWFPGAGFKKKAAGWKKTALETKDLPFDHVKQQMEKGTAKPSVLTAMLEISAHEGVVGGETAEEAVKACASIAYAAGADTTLATVLVLTKSLRTATFSELNFFLRYHPICSIQRI